jgi:hypothetical protein
MLFVSVMMMDAIRTSEMSVYFYEIIPCIIPEGSPPQSLDDKHSQENALVQSSCDQTRGMFCSSGDADIDKKTRW